MAYNQKALVSRLTTVLAVVAQRVLLTGGEIGVNYGLKGDNLPPPKDVINLYKSQGTNLLRLFEPNQQVLNALIGSGLKVCLGILNNDLPSIASSVDAASQWVAENISPYYAQGVNFGWITLGNEVVPGPLASYVAPAMNNMHTALQKAGITAVNVSTVVPGNVLGTSYPPTAGQFSDESAPFMADVVRFLSRTNNPLCVNVYPYLAYASDPTHISLQFANFENKDPYFFVPYTYYSLYEAMVDAFNAALKNAGAEPVKLVVTETGWPSAGDDPYTSVRNAQTYNQNLINFAKTNGTPMRPDLVMDTFIFAMFNEDLKPAGMEQNWGLYYPNSQQPVYPLTF